MQRRKEFLIGSLIGLCIILLALLTAVVAPRPRAALAQDSPRVTISIGESSLIQGQLTWVHVSFHNLPQDSNDDSEFADLSFRYHFERNADGAWTNADSCTVDLAEGDLYITTWYRSPWNHGPSDFSISTTCEVGTYRMRVSVKDNPSNTVIVSGTHDFSISLGPSVDIDMPNTPYNRGTAINPTIKFRDLVQGANYTYQAHLMARNPSNFADICEGTGLERDNTFTLNDVSGNPVAKTITITDACPKNEYTLHVRLRDSDDRLRGSKNVDFAIVTDPSASPSVSVSMSESSPVAPGTEFDVIFSFNDIQDGTGVRTTDFLTNTLTNQPVVGTVCGGSLVGWGEDVQATINSNPNVNRVTIPSDCPVGSYRLESRIDDRSSGDPIISGTADFTIGDPNLTPDAPNVPNYTAKQNSRFDQSLPLGSGGDGTLRYTATGLPPGLGFTTPPPRIAGTPTNHGLYTVTYTVTDADGDPDSVQFNINVNQDFQPSAPTIPNFTGRVGVPFDEDIDRGTGNDTPLSFSLTGLPAGLSLITDTHKITGTPTGVESPTVTYTVRDADGDEASTSFTIAISGNSTPKLDDLSATTYAARVGVGFTQTLPAGRDGNGDLVHSTANLPDGLSFTQSTRTVTGIPATVESRTVTYTVQDEDQDEDSTTFTINVSTNNTPELDNLAATTDIAKVGVPYTKTLPAGRGGDGGLVHTATNLPAGLSFDPNLRRITGEPTTVESKTVAYKVRDVDQDEAGTTFTIEVRANNTPLLDDLSATTYQARVGSPFTQTIPGGSGGDGDLAHTATNLPDGLTFNADTREVTGTPTTAGSKVVVYKVKDEDQDEASTTFTIDVGGDSTPKLDNLSATTYAARVGVRFTQTLPAGRDGNGDLVHSTANLPDGLSFTQSTRTVTGIPATVESRTVTYTVQDEDQDEDSTTFTINVSTNNTPELDNLAATTDIAKVGVPYTKTLPAGRGGDGGLVHTATNLPAGLSFDPNLRRITGEPTTVESKTVAYKVRDVDQDEAGTTFTIEVRANNTPLLDDLSATTYQARVGSPFTQTIPGGSGGDGDLAHTATNLPDGLTFNADTREVTGTPTTAGSKVVVYKVKDEDQDEASTTFTIDVSEDKQPTLNVDVNYTAILNTLFTQQLPGANGGDLPLVYSATGLPPGLSFIAATHSRLPVHRPARESTRSHTRCQTMTVIV